MGTFAQTKFFLMSDTGIAVGFKDKRVRAPRPSQRRGRLSQRTALIREVVRSVVGYAPYERRIMDILRGGGNNPTKRAWRYAKKRLGSHKRAKAKVAEMTAAIASAKKN